MKKFSLRIVICFFLFGLFLFTMDADIYASIYRIINPQGDTVRVSTEPVLKEEEIRQGCQVFLLELGKALPDFSQEKKIKGMVFLDGNGNGRKEKSETGMQNIQVSNGTAITLTDDQGIFELDEEGQFIYLTLPRGFTMTTSWYRIISNTSMHFGLKKTPEENNGQFRFIQLTDTHTDLIKAHNQIIEKAVAEIIDFQPDFVIDTGDMVYEGDKHSIGQAKAWFNRYVSLIDPFNMPVYHVVGNHDVAGIHYHKDVSEQPGYNKWLYYSYFGPAYYSFDFGHFHCIVLDPNQFAQGTQYFEIPEKQLNWLKKDLSFYPNSKPLLVFFHEPINAWKNKNEILDLFKNRTVQLFSGHWHFDVVLKHGDGNILEQVTGALCGQWWEGDCACGRRAGYRVFEINEDQITSFYREVGQKRQIELLEPSPITTQLLKIRANIYTEHTPLVQVQYQIDQGQWILMDVENHDGWFVAKGEIDSDIALAPGYHKVNIKVEDQKGKFSKTIEVKMGAERAITFQELFDHFSTYRGILIPVEGKVKKYLSEYRYNSPSQTFVNGALILKDHSDYGGLLMAEYGIPNREDLEKTQWIEAEVVPLRYHWDSLGVLYKAAILLNLYQLPDAFLLKDRFSFKPDQVQILWTIDHTRDKNEKD